mmetsp:Transcript_166619/g.319823  ORF Transcript_166619/g.319823 Transcript_166619/m.319823 type:complete len:135 (+) Transcript_166619:65-469(+)
MLAVPHLSWKPLKPGDTLQTDFMGVLCLLINILMYGAPLGVVRQVIRTRSVEFMPLGLSLFTLMCSSSWFVYSFLVSDLWIFVPSASGVVLGILQLIIYSMYQGRCRVCGSGAEAPARDRLVSPQALSVTTDKE